MRAALTIILALAVSSSAFAAPRTPGLRPAVETVEGGLWGQADQMEQYTKTSGELAQDEALRSYISGIACKVSAEYCGELRVYVMNRPIFNATMMPNGGMEVWSGLLLRASDESELAFVLGHESAHFIEDHSLESWNNQKVTMTTALVVGGVIGAAGMYYRVDVTDLIDITYMSALASVFSYSRKQETEADRIGFDRFVAAGYRPGAAADIWESLTVETESSDFPRVRKSETRASMFNTHPLTAERISFLRALAAGRPQMEPSREEKLRYRAAIRPHLSAWLRDDLRRRDFGQTLLIISRMTGLREDLGVLEYYRGEIYRLRRKDGDLARARDAYATATAYADCPIAAWRELGDLHRRAGNNAAALAAYQTYVQKAPTADDVWMVEDAIKSLQGTAE